MTPILTTRRRSARRDGARHEGGVGGQGPHGTCVIAPAARLRGARPRRLRAAFRDRRGARRFTPADAGRGASSLRGTSSERLPFPPPRGLPRAKAGGPLLVGFALGAEPSETVAVGRLAVARGRPPPRAPASGSAAWPSPGASSSWGTRATETGPRGPSGAAARRAADHAHADGEWMHPVQMQARSRSAPTTSPLRSMRSGAMF